MKIFNIELDGSLSDKISRHLEDWLFEKVINEYPYIDWNNIVIQGINLVETDNLENN